MAQGTDDNVMDTSPESYGDSDDVMDDSAVSYKNPDYVNPPVTHQYADDIIDNPHETDQEADNILAPSPGTHQTPDNVMDDPPVAHDERYTENLNYDNHDSVVTDSATKMKFQMQITPVSLISLEQGLGVNTPGTSNKACEEYEVNVIALLK